MFKLAVQLAVFALDIYCAHQNKKGPKTKK